MKKSKKNIVYSTNPNYSYEYESDSSDETLPNHQQNLKIFPDKKNRNGKVVSIVSGFVGSSEDLKNLEKKLKALCGSGGTTKNGEILLQGNFIQKVAEYLRKEGYHCKISGI